MQMLLRDSGICRSIFGAAAMGGSWYRWWSWITGTGGSHHAQQLWVAVVMGGSQGACACTPSRRRGVQAPTEQAEQASTPC